MKLEKNALTYSFDIGLYNYREGEPICKEVKYIACLIGLSRHYYESHQRQHRERGLLSIAHRWLLHE